MKIFLTSRMPRKGTRKAGRNNSKSTTRYATRLYGPLKHVLCAAENSIKEITRYVGNISGRSIKGVKRLGNVWAGHTNMAIRNLTKRGGGRMMGGSNSRDKKLATTTRSK